jgi:hypothetical protein
VYVIPRGPAQGILCTAVTDPAPEPVRRPRSLDPQELGFTPRPPVPWLAPLLLASTGLRTLLSALFGAYLDKRELQHALPTEVHQQSGEGGELWLDYVADLGDGFHSTYSVAYLLAQSHLDLDGHRLPRGQVLLMGGDQVYPTASGEAYEDRCKGPYTAALPAPPSDAPQPTLYAVPGNHDWYDGLTAFLRLFVKIRTDHFGGWRLEQSRSYFAIELPHRWWLFAIDIQSGAYVDDPQLLYFEKAAARLGPDDRLILVAPTPSWVHVVDRPKAYDPVDYFVRTIVDPTGAQVKLMLAGDLHHYARYTGPDRQLITCGGGGAYLYPTHHLPERITVPPPETLVRRASQSREYELAGRFPSKERSRRYGWSVFTRLPWRNPGFATLIGTLQTLLMLAMAGVAHQASGTEQRLVTIPLAVMVLVTMMGAVFFTSPPTAAGKRHSRHWLLGVGHGLAQLALAGFGTWVWLKLPFVDWPWPAPLAAAAVFYGPVISLVGSELVAGYLLVAGAFRVNLNELFAGQGIDDAKSFLRLHIARDGTLTVYPVAVDTICREWTPDPEAPADRPWLQPAQPLVPRPAEPPIRVDQGDLARSAAAERAESP